MALLDRLELKLQPIVAPRPNRDEPIPNDEANILVANYLKNHPKATAEQVAEGVGIAKGRVPGMSAWRATMAKRKAAKPLPKAKAPKQATKRQLDVAISREGDPAKKAEADELIRRMIIEEAGDDGEKRAWLDNLTPDQQAEMIKLYAEQRLDDQDFDRGDADG